MTERLVATGRDTLAEAIDGYIDSEYFARRIASLLIDSGVVRVVDPADPELVERVEAAAALAWDPNSLPAKTRWQAVARAAIEAVLS